jgi:hypothetical protein
MIKLCVCWEISIENSFGAAVCFGNEFWQAVRRLWPDHDVDVGRTPD